MVRKTTEQQIAEAEERLRRLRAESRQAERKARNHAMIVLGGLVEAQVPGGWRAIDWDRMAQVISAHGSDIASAAGDRESVSSAFGRLREWERRGREERASAPTASRRPRSEERQAQKPGATTASPVGRVERVSVGPARERQAAVRRPERRKPGL